MDAFMNYEQTNNKTIDHKQRQIGASNQIFMWKCWRIKRTKTQNKCQKNKLKTIKRIYYV